MLYARNMLDVLICVTENQNTNVEVDFNTLRPARARCSPGEIDR